MHSVNSVSRLAYHEKAINFALLFLELSTVEGWVVQNIAFYEITTQFEAGLVG